jgi:hypothetical protein
MGLFHNHMFGQGMMKHAWSIGIVVLLVSIGCIAQRYWGLGGKLVVLYIVLAIFVILSAAVLVMRLRLQQELKGLAPADRQELEGQTDPDDADMLTDNPRSAWRDFIWDIVSVPLALLIVLGPAFAYHMIRYGQFSWDDQMTWVHILIVFVSSGTAIGIHMLIQRHRNRPNTASQPIAGKPGSG